MVLIRIVYCDDVRVREPGNETGLLVETFNKIAISSKPGWENLHSYLPVKVLLVRFVDTSHPFLAKRGQDFIVSKRHTDQIVLLHKIAGAKILRRSCALSPHPHGTRSDRAPVI